MTIQHKPDKGGLERFSPTLLVYRFLRASSANGNKLDNPYSTRDVSMQGIGLIDESYLFLLLKVNDDSDDAI